MRIQISRVMKNSSSRHLLRPSRRCLRFRDALYHELEQRLSNGGIVPDNNLGGWIHAPSADCRRALSPVSPGSATPPGGWNGDLYAYLVHSSGFSVAGSCRPGRGWRAFGYGDAGLNVNLAATGTSIHRVWRNRHHVSGSPAANSELADGQHERSLGSFLSTSPNGTWSLFIADLGAAVE